MKKLELYELKEKLVGLNIDFPQNATRTKLESLLPDTSKEVQDKEIIEAKEDKVQLVDRKATESPKEDEAKALKASERKTPVAKKKRHHRDMEVEEVVVTDKKYIVKANIKGFSIGQPFESSASQIEQLLDRGAIEEVKGV